jgi:hypothetical protein
LVALVVVLVMEGSKGWRLMEDDDEVVDVVSLMALMKLSMSVSVSV